jgi:hypothetical protein
MQLTPQHIELLKQLVEKERQQRPPLPVGGEDLERAGYIAVTTPTQGDLSFLIVQITEAGRRALAAAGQ